MLVLVSHYLSLRLPAEVTLPHRNHPTPTIYAPSGSYISSESRSRFPRPRPLFIGKNLPKLAREDPRTYALFLEGVTLLAWNISWICRTQGLSLASDSWEEICDIGRNLWQLLLAPPAQAATLVRTAAERDAQTRYKSAKASFKTTSQRTKMLPMLGHYSHGTVQGFLGASEGTEFMRTWKLPSPTKIVDQLKTTLLGEMASAEWELLEKNEWDDEQQEPPKPPSPKQAAVPESTHASENGDANRAVPGSAPTAGPDDTDNGSSASNRQKGTSGWMKLRNR